MSFFAFPDSCASLASGARLTGAGRSTWVVRRGSFCPTGQIHETQTKQQKDYIMPTLTNRTLTITRDPRKKTARCVVKCNVNFNALELCQMKACPKASHYRLRCRLMGEDNGLGALINPDDVLFIYSDIFNFPDPTPTATEARTFDITVGESLLDEDIGRDEIYGLLILTNLATNAQLKKKTNVVTGWF
jgi:hypothetical protein